MQTPSPVTFAHIRRFDRVPSAAMSKAVSRRANDSATMSVALSGVSTMPFGNARPAAGPASPRSTTRAASLSPSCDGSMIADADGTVTFPHSESGLLTRSSARTDARVARLGGAFRVQNLRGFRLHVRAPTLPHPRSGVVAADPKGPLER